MSSMMRHVLGSKHKAQLRVPSVREVETLKDAQTTLTTVFTLEDHESLLQELWVAMSHASCPPGSDGYEDPMLCYETVSEAWCLFGFQRDDPVSDIRGGGVLCVQQLIYFMRNHPKAAAEMMVGQQQKTRSRASIARTGISKVYPFAAAGINVTRVVAQVFGLVGPAGNKTPFENESKKFWPLVDELNELYCVVFKLMDKVWVEMDADYMQFKGVMDEVKKRLRACLEKGPATCYDAELILLGGNNGSPGGSSNAGSSGAGGLSNDNILCKGWMEKTPQETGGNFFKSAGRDKWQRRFFVLMRTSPVRSVLAYFKSEDDAQNSVGVGGTSTKGRLILVPTAKVRRVSTVICIDSDGFKLQLRTETKDEADRWVAALTKAIEGQSGAQADSTAAPNFAAPTPSSTDGNTNVTSVESKEAPGDALDVDIKESPTADNNDETNSSEPPNVVGAENGAQSLQPRKGGLGKLFGAGSLSDDDDDDEEEEGKTSTENPAAAPQAAPQAAEGVDNTAKRMSSMTSWELRAGDSDSAQSSSTTSTDHGSDVGNNGSTDSGAADHGTAHSTSEHVSDEAVPLSDARDDVPPPPPPPPPPPQPDVCEPPPPPPDAATAVPPPTPPQPDVSSAAPPPPPPPPPPDAATAVPPPTPPQPDVSSAAPPPPPDAFPAPPPPPPQPPAAPPVPPAPPPVPMVEPPVNRELLESLCNMAFPELQVKKALLAGCQEADAVVDWILAHADDAGIDDPIPLVPATTSD